VPFERAVTEAEAWLVMSAYNSVRGTTMTENELLNTPLVHRLGIRRRGGLGLDRGPEHRAVRPRPARPGDARPARPVGEALVDAVRDGRVPQDAVDEKVRRLLRLAARVGALDRRRAQHRLPSPANQRRSRLAREVSAAGAVLLRNNGVLPWPAGGPASVAVIGEHATLSRTQGGGSATVLPKQISHPLDGLRAALPHAQVEWSRGVPVHQGIFALPLASLTDPDSAEPGLRARYLGTDGQELLSENRRAANLVWLGTLPEAPPRLSCAPATAPPRPPRWG